MVPVVDERGGDVADLVAEQPQAPAEIDVLEEHEVALVEAAGAVEHPGIDHHRRARREEHVGFLVVRGDVGIAGMHLEPVPVERHRRGGEVDLRAVPIEHPAGDAGDAGAALERRDGRSEPLGIGTGVVVEERQVRAGRRLGPAVATAREPEVLLRLDQRDLGRGGTDAFRAPVARRVLDDDDLEVLTRPVEIAEALDARDRVVGAPVVDDDHRHAGRDRSGQRRERGLGVAHARPCTPSPSHTPPSDITPPLSSGCPRSTSKRMERWRQSYMCMQA